MFINEELICFLKALPQNAYNIKLHKSRFKKSKVLIINKIERGGGNLGREKEKRKGRKEERHENPTVAILGWWDSFTMSVLKTLQ